MRGEREARFLSRLRDKVHLARIPNYQKGAGIKLSFSTALHQRKRDLAPLEAAQINSSDAALIF